jgi:hypothetical protein
MAQEFVRPNAPALTKLVDNTMTGAYGSYEDMKTALRNHLGMPSPDAETLSMPPVQTTAQQEALLSEQSAGPQNCIRVLYLHGNDRLEIYGTSEEELDRKEAQLRALYQ